MMTAAGWWNAPTRFLPSGRSTPVLPPIDESIWATSVVGTWMTGTPRRYVAARNPAASPSAPPPIATSGSPRSTRSRASSLRGGLDDRQPLGGLALRAAATASTVQPSAAQPVGERAPRPPPRRPARRRGSPGGAEAGRSASATARRGDALAETNRPIGVSASQERVAGRRRRRSSAASRRRRPSTTAPTSATPASPDVRGGVEPLAARREVADRPDRVAAGDERPDVRRRRRRWARTSGRPSSQTDEPAAVERPAVARVDDGAAAGRDHPADAPGRGRPGRAPATAARSQRPEAGLALLREDRRDRPAGAPSRSLVEVDERRAVALRRGAARRRSCRCPGSPTRTTSIAAQSSPPEPASSRAGQAVAGGPRRRAAGDRRLGRAAIRAR